MVKYDTVIKKFDRQGEKTGWTYIVIPATIAEQLKPGFRKSFRVKGRLDQYRIAGIALLPMGEGDFIMALKAEVRKAIGKGNGATLKVQLEPDETPFVFSPELMMCLEDEPVALANFRGQPGSHQKYFSKWVESGKTEATKARRIASTINAMLKGLDYGAMIRALKNDNEEWLK